MVKSNAASVDGFLAELPEEKRGVVSALREVVLEHLPDGYEESMNWGMICYSVPLERYPDTYNGQPLTYVSIAAQKNNYSLYLTGPYMDPECDRLLREGFASAGRKLDMGKSCLRFKRIEDLPVSVVGAAIARHDPDDFIGMYERSRNR